ncbi:bifunctional 3'-5' exonuclease/DNA polymerase [Agrococcus carbonis]|uniref:DNA-directed DNA polymerase n=1 Tax=Agrococcus carbonis TaxID=684552 RepID=A0A1H1LAV4_9MICO|nr:bifunctional 3'-5' exonuclease/DNA polymerase [Agrococcus carbonis]SDR71636.1 DNA polymerase-1 [Agrococcus carbonis]
MATDVGVVPLDRGERIAVATLVGGRATDAAVHDRAHVAHDARLSAPRARIVWQDARSAVPALLDAGVRLERVRDVRLVHRILVDARGLPAEERWSRALRAEAEGLFSLAPDAEPLDELAGQLAAQEAAIGDDAGLRMLAAAESMGAVIAVELSRQGLPFDRARHDALLAEALGEPPAGGGPGDRPLGMEALAAQVRDALGAPSLNPDSPQEVLKALRRAGLDVASTARWELREHDHPVIAPLIEYKHLARLHTANGRAWAQRWARADAQGRTRLAIEYVPGGVVTGRWATEGSGAMQIARQIRAAVAAEPGMRLVVADAAQLEPRALAAIARDQALAAAGRGTDLYQGLVDRGVVDSRQQAKIGMLGALYGGTTGESAVVLPRLARAYPRAMGVVEAAARAGERRERVRTWLGRTSPLPPRWRDDERGLRQARAWGRFTRNFVVQGTAAEWALAWMAGIRRAIRDIEGAALVCFLHDEVIVHAPEEAADAVAASVREAAADAGRMLFGAFPIEFPVQTAVVADWSQAKG